MSELWRRCLTRLEGELGNDMHTWLLPLQAREDSGGLRLFAPNAYTVDTVREQYLARIREVLEHLAGQPVPVQLEVGSARAPVSAVPAANVASQGGMAALANRVSVVAEETIDSNLDPAYTFDNFVEGNPNQ
ncbi:DnaA N-terminal domain-containing protein, partial [Metallibacterium sp.]